MTGLASRFRLAAVLLTASLLISPLSFGQTSGVCYNGKGTSRCAGSAALIMATPAGGAGQATLRALTAADLPAGNPNGSELRFSVGGPLVLILGQSVVIGPSTFRIGIGVAPLQTDSATPVGIQLKTTTIRVNLVNGAPSAPGDQGRVILYESTNSGLTYSAITLLQFNVNPSNTAITASASFVATLNSGNQYVARFDMLGTSIFNGNLNVVVY